MHMLSILSVVFCIALFFMCYFREKLHHRFIEPLFIIADAVFFFCWNYAKFERGSLGDGFMTFDNISPFICTLILVIPLLSEKIKKYAYAAIAFLAFGMFVALFVSPEVEYLMNYHQDAMFLHVSEAACHLIMGLYGFYLVLSGKVGLSMKSFGKALICIYSVIGFGLFLNLCFHRSFFGMNMYGEYSIYFMDIFGSFEATLLAYLLGVLFTITVGFFTCRFLDWLSEPRVKIAVTALESNAVNDSIEKCENPE